MRMFLLGCIVLFILVIITAALKTKRPDGQATRRRRRERQKAAHSFESVLAEDANSEPSEEQVGEQEADALGLKADPLQEAIIDEKNNNTEPKGKKTTIKYVVLHVMAPKNHVYSGYELLQALLARGLRYGKDKIFHRYQQKSGLGEELFSLTSVNKPGTFDLPNMGSFSCPGLTLFTIFKDVQQPKEAVELMLDTAKQLAQDLSGEVWDENHQPITMGYLANLRTELDHYMEQTRTRDLFVEV